MDERPPSSDAGLGSGPETKPRTPRWVKVFGIIGLVLAVLIILMVAGVFGEGHGPGRHMGGARNDKPSGGIGGPADAGEAARTVEVTTLDTMTFAPARIDVSAGETVTFVVTNSGKVIHEFTLGDGAMQQQHAQAMAHMPSGMAHGFPNAITLRPGETKRLTWRFGDAGSLEFACHEPGHYQAGMRGHITIT